MNPLLPLGLLLIVGALFASSASEPEQQEPGSGTPEPGPEFRWEGTTVKKSEVDEYLNAGWEPLGASIVAGQTFRGAPVTREYWHLRRRVPTEAYGISTGAAGIRGVHLPQTFSAAQIAAYNREGALQGLRGASVAPPG